MDFLDEIIHDELSERPSTSHRKVSTTNEKIQGVIQDMMFANGDALNPKSECINFMEQILREQLLLILDHTSELAKSRSEVHFKLSDLLFNFYRHPNFVCRLVKYASDRLMLASFSGSFEDGSNTEIHHHRNHADLEKFFCSAFREFDQTGNLSQLIDQCLKPDHVDQVKQARQSRILRISERMNTDTYLLFSKARKRCLCYSHDRHIYKPFIEWIGKSSLDSYSVLVFNFLASEIVVQMVENALLVRASDPKFQDQSMNLHEIPLELEHYKSALRRNIGYQSNRNLLFGYVNNTN